MPKITVTDDNAYTQILTAEAEKHEDLLFELELNDFNTRQPKKTVESEDVEKNDVNHEPKREEMVTTFISRCGSDFPTILHQTRALLTIGEDQNIWPLIVILMTASADRRNENFLASHTIRMLKHHKKDLLTAIGSSDELQALLRYKLNPIHDATTQCDTHHLDFYLFRILSLRQHKSHPVSGHSLLADYTKPATNSAKALFHLLGLTTERKDPNNADPLYQIMQKRNLSFQEKIDQMNDALPNNPEKLDAVKASIALGQNPQTLGNFMLSTDLLAVLLASLPKENHKLSKNDLLWLSKTACKQQLLFAIEQHPEVFRPLITNKNTLLDVVIDYQKHTPVIFKTDSKTRKKVDAIMQAAPPVNHPQ